MNRRVIKYHDRPKDKSTGMGRAIAAKRAKLKNRRVTIAQCEDGVAFVFKALTDDRKVSVLEFGLSYEAAWSLLGGLHAMAADGMLDADDNALEANDD